MKIDDILENLNDIKSLYKEFIITNNYKKVENNKISWDNYKSGIFKNFYSKEYEYVIKNRQYSFLLKDNLGCVQYYYEFDKDKDKEEVLLKVKMAYYPYPVATKDKVDDFENYLEDPLDEYLMEYYYDIWEIFNHQFELNLNDTELQEILYESKSRGNNESIENLLLAKFDDKYEYTNSSHIRVDFDAKVVSHNKCEIQIGAVNNIRFPLKEIISPLTFFDFIVKNIFRGSSKYDALIKTLEYKTKFSIHRKKNIIPINNFKEDNLHII
ncbi:DUF2290 domain-containing protein [Myroides odoratimimus]|uniref:DUF2290 domain-containing protein n=1 Tax=Myroides odoratimimus TaxID=76832 RepID=UPI002578FAD0|nr:DUF2290 domain-containing protein [Myroides odoratimimus]MDM1397770.1 DUF2290 domain-containing protein [Myroides odoratimimus]